MKNVLGAGISLCMAMMSSTALAAVDANAAIVQLRVTCSEAGTPLDNCFTNLDTLNSWIWDTRHPSAAAPLKVEIGPGTFEGQFSCYAGPGVTGHVSLVGSGMGTSVLARSEHPVFTQDCEGLVFESLSMITTDPQAGVGVHTSGGSSVWKNVEIRARGYAWYDEDSPSVCRGKGVHRWFASRIVADGAPGIGGPAYGYYNSCDESWFYGSEIVAHGSGGQSRAIWSLGGEVHVYGSALRAVPEPGAILDSIEVVLSGGGHVHIHGTGIDAMTDTATPIYALLSGSASAVIHANESSYMLMSAGGQVRRVSTMAGGKVWAPYQWQTAPTPPAIYSLTGYDTVIVTNTVDGNPHLLMYKDSCASRWFDTHTKACF